jgi:hypothetical protein
VRSKGRNREQSRSSGYAATEEGHDKSKMVRLCDSGGCGYLADTVGYLPAGAGLAIHYELGFLGGIMKTIAAVLFLALLISNLSWYRSYRALDRDDMQTSALLDWSNELLRPYSANEIQFKVWTNHTISAHCRHADQSIDFDGNSENITLSCN